MMKRYYLLIIAPILMLTIVSTLSSQTVTINASVTDYYTHEPLESAVITVLRNSVTVGTASTDALGNAELTIAITTEVRRDEGMPVSFSLSNNYPNPFTAETSLDMGVPESQSIAVDVYNVLGQLVASERFSLQAGYYTLNLSLSHLPTGVYFLKAQGTELQSVKLLKLGDAMRFSGQMISVKPGSPGIQTIVSKASGTEYTIRVSKEGYETTEENLIITGDISLDMRMRPLEEATTSYDLIDEALEAGEIDEETALIYKVYAAFNDNRLPVNFRGDDRRVTESYIMHDLSEKYWNDALSPEAEEILGPFMVMPMYEGSWWDMRHRGETEGIFRKGTVPPCHPRRTCDRTEEWSYAGGHNVKVWYQQRYAASDSSMAVDVVGVMENRIWPRLTEYMMKEPVSDADMRNNGGDGRLDIILFDGSGALAYPYRGCGGNSNPTYILVSRNMGGEQLAALLAHEFMHSIQNAFTINGCLTSQNHLWWAEASAVWAETYAWRGHAMYDYIRSRRWDVQARHFLNRPEKSLYDVSNHDYMYGSYLWPLYIEKELDEKHVMRIWHHLGRENEKPANSLDGIDGFLKQWALGGFEEQWPKFVLSLWNRDDYDILRQWNGTEHGARMERDERVSLGGNTERMMFMQSDLEPLSAVYYRYEITGNDTRSLMFANGFTRDLEWRDFEISGGLNRYSGMLSAGELEGRNVQALFRYRDKGWDPNPPESLSLTEHPGIVILRDGPDDKLEEVVFIFSNAKLRNKAAHRREPSHLELSNFSNYQWNGSVTMTNTDDGVTETVNIRNLVWRRADYSQAQRLIPGLQTPLMPVNDISSFLIYNLNYELVSGTLSWNISGTRETTNHICTYSGSENLTLSGSGMMNVLITAHHHHSSAKAHRSLMYQGYSMGLMPPTATTTVECVDKRDGSRTTDTSVNFIPCFAQYANWMADDLNMRYQAENDGKVIRGNLNDIEDYKDIDGPWRLESPN